MVIRRSESMIRRSTSIVRHSASIIRRSASCFSTAVLLLDSGLASRERSCTISSVILISFLLAVLLPELSGFLSGLACRERSCFLGAVLHLGRPIGRPAAVQPASQSAEILQGGDVPSRAMLCAMKPAWRLHLCTDVILINTSTSYRYKLLDPTTCIPKQVVGFNNLWHQGCCKLLDPTTWVLEAVSM